MVCFRKILPLLFVVLSLAACQHTLWNPQPMGRGYSSYNETYKSVRGVDAKSAGYDFSVESNQAVIDDLRLAAKDLVSRMDSEISYSTDQLYLDIPASGVFYGSFDYVLRDEFLKRGYTLANASDQALSVTLVAHDVPEMNQDRSVNGYRFIYLALASDVVDGTAGTLVGDVYEVPVHDFKPTKGIKSAHDENSGKCSPCKKKSDENKCGKCKKADKCKKSREQTAEMKKCSCDGCGKCSEKGAVCTCENCKDCGACRKEQVENPCHKKTEQGANAVYGTDAPVPLK